MTAEGIIDVYLACPFHITVACSRKVDVHLSKIQKAVEVDNALV